MNINYELDELDPSYFEEEEKRRFLDECSITSFSESEYRLYINNKLDSITLLLKSIIDVLNQQGEHSK